MFKRYALLFMLSSLMVISTQAQELTRITPVKAEASSFYKDLNARLSRQYRQYREYLVDNSPEMAFDNDEKSMWASKGKIKGEWIKIEFPYPIIASHLKVLTGFHVTKEIFRMTKTVKKFEVENDRGEKTKLTIKNPAEATGFELGFKKPTKTLKLTILSVDNETSRNTGTTTGFADIVVGHRVYDSEGLAAALEAEDLTKIKKEIKAALKKVSNPHAITVRGQNPIVWATETGKESAAKYLWENGFRYNNTENAFLTAIETQGQLNAHFANVNTLHEELQSVMSKLKQPNASIKWAQLDQYETDLDNKYKVLGQLVTTPVAQQIETLRPIIASTVIKQDIDALSKGSAPVIDRLKTLSYLDSEKHEIYYWLSPESKREIETLRQSTINSVLASHTQKVSYAIDQTPLRISTILTLNKKRKEFVKQYNQYTRYEAHKNLLNTFTNKKTAIVEKHAGQLREYIGNLAQTKEVDKLKSTYFSNIAQTSVTVGLTNELSAKKRTLIATDKARKEAERKAELARKKAELKKLYSKVMENSKREITIDEWRQVTRAIDNDSDDLEHFYPTEMDVYALFSSYLLNNSFNTVYVHNQAKSESVKYLSAQKMGEKIAFKNDQEIDSYWDPNKGIITYRSRPRVKKVVDSGAWRLAQRCRSVKNYLETTTSNELSLVSVVIHKPTGLPVLFKTSLSERTCVLKGAYDNCSLPCFRYANKGSDNWYFYISDYMRQWNTN